MTKADHKPLISVIVPVFDVEDHVGAAITSLKAQTWQNFEAIVIDDGSQDASFSRCVEAIAGDPRFQLHRQPNRGLSAARNAGLSRATGSFVAFLDADDRFAADFLERTAQALIADGGDWVATALYYVYPDGGVRPHSAIHGKKLSQLPQGTTRFDFTSCLDVTRHFPSAWNKLYRRAFLEGVRFAEGSWYEDHVFYHTLAARADYLLYIPEPLYLQAQGRQGQITSRDSERVFQAFDVLEAVHSILRDSGREHADKAYASLIARMSAERAQNLWDADRRARFAQKTRDVLAAQNVDPEWPRWSTAWKLEVEQTTVMSLVIAWTTQSSDALYQTLAALKGGVKLFEIVVLFGQTHRDAQEWVTAMASGVTVVCVDADAPAPESLWKEGLARAEGEYVCFAKPGEMFSPEGLTRWMNLAFETNAQLVLADFWQEEWPDRGVHGAQFAASAPLTNLAKRPGLTALEALSLNPMRAARAYARDFLTQHELKFSAGRHPAWAMGLGAALLAERMAHLAEPFVTIPPPADQSPDAFSMVAGFEACIDALPEGARARLPDGWQRRLFARFLWWEVNRCVRPKLPRFGFFLARVAQAARTQGFSDLQKLPAGFDSVVGPKLLRVLAPTKQVTGEISGQIANETSPAREGDLFSIGLPSMIYFPFKNEAFSRFRASFHNDEYANITFYDEGGQWTPFHISLRFREQVISCNDMRNDGQWRQERHMPFVLPKEGVTISIEMGQGRAVVRIDGEEIMRLSRRSPFNRQGVSGLKSIHQIELEGDLKPLALMPQMPERELSLDPRLVLRAALQADGAQIVMAHQDKAIDVLPGPSGLEAPLPGWCWAALSESDTLVLAVRDQSGRDVGKPLMLTRAEFAARLDDCIIKAEKIGDSSLYPHFLEHIQAGDLTPYLSERAKRIAADISEHFGVANKVSDGETATAALDAELPAKQVSVLDTALALVAARAAEGAKDLPAIAANRIVPENERQSYLIALSEFFCCSDQDLDALRAATDIWNVAWDHVPDSTWARSGSLPYIYRAEQPRRVVDTLRGLRQPGQGWEITPAIAWVARQAIQDTRLHDADRQDILYAFMDYVGMRAGDFWGRAHCSELTRTAADLLAHHGRSDYFAADVRAFTLRAFGLSRAFWETLGPLDRHDPEIASARSAFEKLAKGVTKTNAAELDAALRLFDRWDNPDVARWRRDIFGHGGIPQTGNKRITANTFSRFARVPGEAALRHMAAPFSRPVADDVADLTASYMPDLYRDAPKAPYFAGQVAVSEQIGDLLSANGAPHDGALDEIWPHLSRMAGGTSEHLGIGLALTLLAALGDREECSAFCADLLARVRLHMEQQWPADRARCAAAPVTQRGLWQLSQSESPWRHEVFALFDYRAQSKLEGVECDPRNPLFDSIVCVFSCKPYLKTRIPALEDGWLTLLEDLGVPYVVVVGDGDGSRVGNIVSLDAPDDYEGLPQKTLAAVRWVYENTDAAHMIKIDDDCFLNAPLFFKGLSYSKFAYYGRILTRVPGQMDRVWHQSKSNTPRGKVELDKSPEPSIYADGGSAYALSRIAMQNLLEVADSPDGQRLIQASFMEDKMVGDLLAMRGIVGAREDYRTTVRRRTGPGAVPVPSWQEGFFPSRAAPVQLAHLDLADDQAIALKHLKTAELAPKRIWPSYLDAQLGHNGNGLEMLTEPARAERVREAEVAVMAVMRNEMFLLPHFLEHYRSMGVTAFAVADNGSDDGTREYLMAQPDVAVFAVDTEYRLSQYGVAWQQAMLSVLRPGKWTLIADADEFLVFEYPQKTTLPELVRGFEGAEAVRVFMLDMYPGGPLEEATFESGDLFAEAGYCEAHPFLTALPVRGPYSNQLLHTSALRHRLIADARPNLFVAQKLALLKYQPWMRLSAGLHFLGDAKMADRELLFAHFKYNADFYRKAQAEVSRRQHFNDAEEYRKYLALASEGRSVIHHPQVSTPWLDCDFVKSRLSP
ncbi:glycosyltransferase [Roseobacteraceae bacterium S113]